LYRSKQPASVSVTWFRNLIPRAVRKIPAYAEFSRLKQQYRMPAFWSSAFTAACRND
jgi:hypothetical protein